MNESARETRPIGMFDSGVGGLSVLRAIRERLPRETLVYVADTAHVPYGEKSRHAITARALTLTEYFLSRGAKALAIPCNTATAAAINTLRERYPDLPIVGIEPAVKPAAQLTRSGIIGVLATTGTLNSPRFRTLAQREAPHTRILHQPCPQWVLAVERGVTGGSEARAMVEPPVRHLLDQGADVLVLGCTHFPFLLDVIRDCAGPGIPVLETGQAVARQLERLLVEGGCASSGGPGQCELLTSGEPALLHDIGSRLLNSPMTAAALPAAWR